MACDGDISPSDTICFDPGVTYPVTFTGSGGMAPYTFTYSVNGGSPQTITSTGTGNIATLDIPMTVIGNTQYTLISVTDANGCTVTVNESSNILTIINADGMVSGTNTVYQNSTPFPAFTFTASGGIMPYTFSYTLNGGPIQTITTAPGSNTATLPISTAVVGVYTVVLLTVQSSIPCPNLLPPGIITTNTATITVIPVPMVVSGSNQTVCTGAASANATFTASGSSGPYTYTYTVGGSTQTITGGSPISIPAATSPAGTTGYTLTGITDVYGNYQAVNATSTVTVLPAPTGNLFFGGSFCDHYSITFSASGGSGPFVYNYTVNGTPMTVSGGSSITLNGPPVFGPTTYTISGISVTNAAGCTGPLNGGGTITIQPYFGHTISVSSTSVCVNGLNPVVTFSNLGGGSLYPTFYYSVNSGPSQSVSNNPSFATVSVPTTTAGTFVYTLFGSANMCDVGPIQSVTVVVKPLPTASISGTASVCKNATSPVITFTGTNGTAPYTFTYKINGGANQTVSSGAGATATVSVPTNTTGTLTYSLVSVSSAAGCSQNQTGSAVVTVNPLPTAGISGTTTLCQNAASPVITFTGANGTAPYTFSYNINGGATQTLSSGSASTATVSVPTSVAGTFTYNLLSVSSAVGCSQAQTGAATITINPAATASISGTTTLCQNAVSPTITFTGANATGPYMFTYKINGGANQTISSGGGTTATISVPTSTAGTFTYSLVAVSGANGCLQNQTGSAVITINPAPSASVSGTTVLCQNDAAPLITFTGTNGAAPYTFSYNVNGGITQTISSGSSSTATIAVPTSTSGLFTYNLLDVSNANSCSQVQTGSATVTINPMPSAVISGTATLCQNGASATVTFTGANGTAPYTFYYALNGGSIQTLSSGSSSTAMITVPTGNTGTFSYDLSSISSGGCSQPQTGSAVITINPAPSASISGTTTICQNDASPDITFTGMNGTIPYTFSYQVNGGTTQTVSSGSGSTATISVPTNSSGAVIYHLLGISDAGSCSQTQSDSAVVTVNASPGATITGNAAVCQNEQEQITFTGSSGVAPYVFSYTVNGGPVQTISSGSGATAQISVLTTNPANYVYVLTEVSDVNGCIQNPSASIGVAVNEQPLFTGITPVCEGNSVQLTAGGSTPVTSWTSADPSVASVSNSGLLMALSSGTTTISCTNSAGCSDSQTVQIISLPNATISGNATICEGNTTVFTISGTPNASVSYTDGLSNFTTTIPASGSIAITTPVLIDTTSYTLSNIQSACLQTLSGSIEIDVTPIPVMGPVNDLTVCPQELVQIPGFTAASGTQYTWTNTNTSIGLASGGSGAIADFTALNNQPGIQTGIVTVTPSLNGCIGPTVSFGINVSQLPVASAGADQAFCLNDGSAHAIGSPPVSGISYSWSPANNLSDPTVSNPSVLSVTNGQTVYVLTVTTASGCQNTDTVLFTGIDSPVISLTASSPFACENGVVDFHLQSNEQVLINWFADDSPLGAHANETDWSAGFPSGSHSVYAVAVNDSGCSDTAAITGGILVYPAVHAVFTTGLNSNVIYSSTDHIELINESENATAYDWFFNGGWFSSETSPVLTFEPGNNFITIQLVAENDFGCSDTALLQIEPLNEGVFYVPNTFTPDGDQFNSVFMPVISDDFDRENYLFEIYNRWGELLFSTKEVTEGWTGTFNGLSCKTDTYTWKLTLKSTRNELNRVITGHVNLLR